jgi:hypothetical protein
MSPRPYIGPTLIGFFFGAASLHAQMAISGRVVDETGAGVAGARVELRRTDGSLPVVSSSDPAGNFSLNLNAAGDYEIRTERQGFYLFRGIQRFEAAANQLTVTLNHVQEFSEHVDVTYSPPAIDPQRASDRRELENAEIQAVPHPAPQDYRASLPLMNGVVQDNAGRLHVNGADTDQTNFTLDGFNISDPVTGRLEARVNLETIQSIELDSANFSAENGRGGAGVLDIKTKMGDDRWRFGGTNFIPGVATYGGLHVNKWTPRLEVSGPLARGRAWFHNGIEGFYSLDTIHGLPHGQNRTRGLTAGDLSRFQVNVTTSNILSIGFLFNLASTSRTGLSVFTPAEATINHRQRMYMSSIRDQQYFAGGALLDFGFSDTRILVRDLPQGTSVYEITPFGNRGNYFSNLDRHSYRQQWIANLFLPTLHLAGEHRLKFGIDFERESFHQQVRRHAYEVLRDDNSVARYVTFAGSPFEARKNFEGAQYIEDRWTVREGLSLETGLRAEWNEIARDLELAPRLAAAWAPHQLRNTKFSAGWGIYYDAISLGNVTRQQDQVSMATFFLPGGVARGPVETIFRVNDQALLTPRYQVVSAAVERRLPRALYLKAAYTRRAGNRGFTFLPATPQTPEAVLAGGAVYGLANTRRTRYDALDISVRRTFAREFEWFAGYTRSSSRSNAAVEYSLENPVFAPQMPGPFPWDTPNRFHMWGWVPVSGRLLPEALRFVTRNTSAAYLVEYRTGFPFSAVDEEGFLAGLPNSRRFPGYFSVNLAFERKFRAIHYLWAWRFGFDNLTNNGNPNVVNNVIGTPQFLTYGRGQPRAFSVRLRLLGRK